MPGSEAWALGDFSRRSNPPPLGGGEVAQVIEASHSPQMRHAICLYHRFALSFFGRYWKV